MVFIHDDESSREPVSMERADGPPGKLGEGATSRPEVYVQFWRELTDAIRGRISASPGVPEPQCRHFISAGVPCFHFLWAFRGGLGGPFAVELHFESKNEERKKVVLRKMEGWKGEVEKGTRERAETESTRREARLYIQNSEAPVGDELKKWAVGKMVILYNLLQPELEKLQ
jgi:hypothetical protein